MLYPDKSTKPHGIDGIYGPKTKAKLEAALSSSVSSAFAAEEGDVHILCAE
ncbi:hypothetical protein P4T89_18830 [Bacillus nakamurai]|uniref:hypothetical protein n=1 Tax=Bacillus nakamurai TaxID=1793963 RepID=UPI000B002480|nr:hypothetical protein [Bacillus nakamurai]MCC9023593.1 hypothetical protein [Bacillus nakamurai]MED1229552.1 hypothetical protein [Bacillus nakamurai]